MNTEPNYLNALQTLAKWGTPADLVHTEWAEYDSASNAITWLYSELGEDIEACYLSDCDIDCEDKDELRKKYGLDDDADESDLLVEWYSECEEYNRQQIDRILNKFGITEGWKIRVPEETDIVIRTAYEHCHDYGRVLVYLKDNEDTEEREEDYDHIYEDTTIEDAVNDAVKVITDAKSSAHQVKIAQSIIDQCGSLY